MDEQPFSQLSSPRFIAKQKSLLASAGDSHRNG